VSVTDEEFTQITDMRRLAPNAEISVISYNANIDSERILSKPCIAVQIMIPELPHTPTFYYEFVKSDKG
jgi:hypothetical protein